MLIPVPARPFKRAPGTLDAFVARTDTPHLLNEAAPGEEVEVRGWIIDAGHQAVTAAWIDIGGFPVPVLLNCNRIDVARAYSMDDQRGTAVGFETLLRLPIGVPIGLHDVSVIGRTASGSGVFGKDSQQVRIVHPYAELVTLNLPAKHSYNIQSLRVGDTQRAPYTPGRGAFTIRQESSLRLSGRIEGAEALSVSATPVVGSRVAWKFDCDRNGRFDAALWTGALKRGLHRMSVAYISNNGELIEPGIWFELDIAGPHHLPPMHLTALRTPPKACIMHFASAAPRDTPELNENFVAGQPIGVSGWCLDPAAGSPVLAVYFQVDDLRPVPLSHHLDDPRTEPSTTSCGFGGIIDTTRLEPGAHRIRFLGAAVSGAGWYVIDERRVDLNIHRRGLNFGAAGAF